MMMKSVIVSIPAVKTGIKTDQIHKQNQACRGRAAGKRRHTRGRGSNTLSAYTHIDLTFIIHHKLSQSNAQQIQLTRGSPFNSR